jgi:hypothetical protein
MATNFPGGIDTFTAASPTSGLDNPSHSGLHNDLGDGLTAVQTQLVNQPYGLVHINETTIGTTVSAVSVENVFSANYDSYKIIIDTANSTNTNDNVDLTLRLRVGGTDATGADFVRRSAVSSGSALSNSIQTTSTSFSLGGFRNTRTDRFFCSLELISPFIAKATKINFSSFNEDSGTFFGRFGTGLHDATTSYTGFSLILSTGTITGGKIRVYGYKN